MDIESYFLDPSSKRQKQYEALRAFAVEKLPAEEVAEKYGYQTSTIYTMIRDVKAGKLELFPSVEKGPRQRRTSADHQKQILDLRKQNHSIHDIWDELLKLEINVSVKTIERIVKENGFSKLPRRSDQQRGVTHKNKLIPESSENLDMTRLGSFTIDCPSVGVFFLFAIYY